MVESDRRKIASVCLHVKQKIHTLLLSKSKKKKKKKHYTNPIECTVYNFTFKLIMIIIYYNFMGLLKQSTINFTVSKTVQFCILTSTLRTWK